MDCAWHWRRIRLHVDDHQKRFSTSSLLIKMLGGLVGRLLGMAILIFIAIKMNAFYGVLFVIVFSITHFILVLRVALKKKSQTPPKQNEEN
jgi:ABC-type nickel/cobalt efflux system permease component RcnA